MALPENWILKSDSEEATFQRAGSSEQSRYRQSWVVNAGTDAFEAHAHFSQQLDGGSGTIYGRSGAYTFNYESHSAKHLGNGYWEVEANYITSGGGQSEEQEQPEGGGGPIGIIRSITYDSTGGMQHITSALDERRFGANAPDMKKAIGVNGDSVEGVDVVVPVFEWTEEYEIPGALATASYFQTVSKLTGKINNEEFRGYAAGEVLFLGISGGVRYNPNQQIESEAKTTRLAFRFAAKENQATAPSVGDIALTDIGGWDYIWVRYDDAAQNGIGLKTPVAVYANKVYKSGDFSTMRLA